MNRASKACAPGVAAVWSAWRSAWRTDSEFETYDLIAAAVEALRA
ncbi:MAG: hypothetical protein ACKOEY_17525 [Phenylobacterium sp.]